jgi:hypothetical protein
MLLAEVRTLSASMTSKLGPKKPVVCPKPKQNQAEPQLGVFFDGSAWSPLQVQNQAEPQFGNPQVPLARFRLIEVPLEVPSQKYNSFRRTLFPHSA